jgi:hypothetical protein
MRRIATRALLVCAATAASLVLAAPAGASSSQPMVMQDDFHLFRSSGATREATLDEMKALGADIVKVQVYWNEITPGPRKPAGFDGTNPANYEWSRYDAIVRGTVRRGMQPYLSLGGRAPDWAVRRRTRRNNGTYRPSASEFGRFAQAAGRRYPGVVIWSAWNEGNLSSWLQPQRTRGGTPLSPSIYRRLYLAAHSGLRASGHGGDTILLGELAPIGSGTRNRVRPLEFLREMACLNRRYRAYRGRSARRRGCRGRIGRIPTSGLALHAYPPRGGIRRKPRRDDASLNVLGRVTRTLDRIARRGRLPRRLPVWNTEYGFQTNPPDPFQYRIRRVPGMLDESEWIAFRTRRLRSHSQYTLVDDPPNDTSSIFARYAGFQGGLKFSNGRRKPGVYDAFRMPAFVRVRGNRAEIFAGLRFAPGATATIFTRRRGGSYRELARATLNAAGYMRRRFRISGAGRRVYRIRIGSYARTKRPARR